ncbi:MAG: glycosyltransferase family 2 protein [Selenomonas sp.]
MPAVSVIMPVYNAEKYLGTAIESVLAQSLSDFDLILVDDGSEDRSPEICDAYAAKDDRIHVLHKKNGGICDARNKGMDMAHGKYVAFIDNDDVYSPNLLKDNYALAEKYHADVVKYGCRCLRLRGDELVREETFSMKEESVFFQKDISECYPRIHSSGINNFVWNGIYQREFLLKYQLQYDTQYKFGFEDLAFNLQIYSHMKCLAVNPQIYYTWNRRLGESTSTKFDPSRLDAILEVVKTEKKLLDKLHVLKSFAGRQMVGGLCYYLGDLTHTGSRLSLDEKIRYLEAFRSCFGKIATDVPVPVHQKVYTVLYDCRCDRLLLLLKKVVNVFRKLKYGSDYV